MKTESKIENENERNRTFQQQKNTILQTNKFLPNAAENIAKLKKIRQKREDDMIRLASEVFYLYSKNTILLFAFIIFECIHNNSILS